MIHTDGRPTIANAYASEKAHHAPIAAPAALSDDEALLEREYAGVRVTVHHFAGRVCLRVEDGEGVQTAIVPSDKALDAFAHPYVYLPR